MEIVGDNYEERKKRLNKYIQTILYRNIRILKNTCRVIYHSLILSG